MFEKDWNKIAKKVYTNAVNHGFWKETPNDGERIALIHAEVSEALEALRDGNPSSNKIIEFTSLEEELADVIIRIMDYSFGKDLDIAGAIIAKIEYNQNREYMHGKSFWGFNMTDKHNKDAEYLIELIKLFYKEMNDGPPLRARQIMEKYEKFFRGQLKWLYMETK